MLPNKYYIAKTLHLFDFKSHLEPNLCNINLLDKEEKRSDSNIGHKQKTLMTFKSRSSIFDTVTCSSTSQHVMFRLFAKGFRFFFKLTHFCWKWHPNILFIINIYDPTDLEVKVRVTYYKL